MKIHDLNGKKICILGFGKEGQATLKALEKHACDCEITVADENPKLRIAHRGLQIQKGAEYLNNLSSFDLIIKSPGIPPKPEFETVNERMTSSSQIFLDSIADSGAIVIGVTGSKGKSTTSTLIYEILKAGGVDVALIGNIGEPAISHLDEAGPGKVFVMEMSSYQLMNLTVSPRIAVVTSFFPEHLDYHASAPPGTGSTPLERYKDAKKHIVRFQKKDDAVFYCATSDGARDIAMESRGTRIPFRADECPVPINETKLLGEHNRSNISAAYKVGLHLKIPRDTMIVVIRSFNGLPHRLRSLGIHHGIEWVDDAISTTPESTIAALDALGDRVETIILGGQDRGNDFTELSRRIARSSVKTVILFPGSGPRIGNALEEAKAKASMFQAESMKMAVKFAIHEISSNPRPIVLLSTASPSYNMFKNFEEKGNEFARCIMA